MMEVGDNRSYKPSKAPMKLSPLTNQHSTFYRPNALPIAQPTVSEHWRECSLAIHCFTWQLLILYSTLTHSSVNYTVSCLTVQQWIGTAHTAHLIHCDIMM